MDGEDDDHGDDKKEDNDDDNVDNWDGWGGQRRGNIKDNDRQQGGHSNAHT